MAKISNKEIALAIYRALKGKTRGEFSKALSGAIHFLARRRLLYLSGEILRQLQAIEDKESGILRMKLESPRSLSGGAKHNLRKILEKRYRVKKLVFEEAIAPELLGGFRLETQDEVIDLTLKNKINIMKEYLGV